MVRLQNGTTVVEGLRIEDKRFTINNVPQQHEQSDLPGDASIRCHTAAAVRSTAVLVVYDLVQSDNNWLIVHKISSIHFNSENFLRLSWSAFGLGPVLTGNIFHDNRIPVTGRTK